jgi:hypothetical protein
MHPCLVNRRRRPLWVARQPLLRFRQVGHKYDVGVPSADIMISATFLVMSLGRVMEEEPVEAAAPRLATVMIVPV